jgi:predicted dehydrogenase
MNDSLPVGPSRRRFLKTTAAVSALACIKIPFVHAAEDNATKVALVGCGGRGTGAASNALSVSGPPIKLVAMADVLDNRLKSSIKSLSDKYKDQVDVPEDRQFIGFDGFKHAVDSVDKNGVVILTTPPAFRWVHFQYAIDKGVNVFMEKPVCTDGPTARRMFALNEQAKKKNLKVGVGLMCRHCKARQATVEKVRNGEVGDIMLIRAYRQQGPIASFRTKAMPDTEKSEVIYQIKNFHSFIWASGGCFSDFNIHGIDEGCMLKGAFPIEAKASGGRHYREDWVDQNFDSYAVEYTFPDGAKMNFEGRTINGCNAEFACYGHGTKGLVVFSRASHTPAKSAIFSGQRMKSEEMTWSFPQPEPNPYQLEWDELVDAIRTNTPYNEVDRGVQASLVTAMGRMAAHTGQLITYDQALNWEHELAPDVDKLNYDSPAPVQATENGHYPWPMPGEKKNREY